MTTCCNNIVHLRVANKTDRLIVDYIMIKLTSLLAIVAVATAKPQIPISGGPLQYGGFGGFGSVSSLPSLGVSQISGVSRLGGVSQIGGSSLSSFPLGGFGGQFGGGVKVLGIERIPDSSLGVSGPTISDLSGSSVSSYGGSVLSGGGSIQPLGVKVLGVQNLGDSSLGLSGANVVGSGISGDNLVGSGLSGANLVGSGLSGAGLASSGISGPSLQQLAGLGGTVTKIERISGSGSVSGGDVSANLPLSAIQQILKTDSQQISGDGVQQIGSPRITQVTRIGGHSTSGQTTTITPLVPTITTIQQSTISGQSGESGQGLFTTQGLEGTFETSTTGAPLSTTTESSALGGQHTSSVEIGGQRLGGATGVQGTLSTAQGAGQGFGAGGSRFEVTTAKTSTFGSKGGAGVQGGRLGAQGAQQGFGAGGGRYEFTASKTSTFGSKGVAGAQGSGQGAQRVQGGQQGFGVSGGQYDVTTTKTSTFGSQGGAGGQRGRLGVQGAQQGFGVGGSRLEVTTTKTSTFGSQGGAGAQGSRQGAQGALQGLGAGGNRFEVTTAKTSTFGSKGGAGVQGSRLGAQGAQQGFGTGGGRYEFTASKTTFGSKVGAGAQGSAQGGQQGFGVGGGRYEVTTTKTSTFGSQGGAGAQGSTQGAQGALGAQQGFGTGGGRYEFTASKTSTFGSKGGAGSQGNRLGSQATQGGQQGFGVGGGRYEVTTTKTSTFGSKVGTGAQGNRLAAQGAQGFGVGGGRYEFTASKSSTLGSLGSGFGGQGSSAGQRTRTGSGQSNLKTSISYSSQRESSVLGSQGLAAGGQGSTFGTRTTSPLGGGSITTTESTFVTRKQQGSSGQEATGVLEGGLGAGVSSSFGTRTGSAFGSQGGSSLGTGGVQRTVTKVQETYTTSGQKARFPTANLRPLAGAGQSSRTQQTEFVRGQTTTGNFGVQGGAGYTQTTGAPGALGGVQRTVTKVQETYTTSGQQPLGPGGQVVVVPVTGGTGSVQSSRTQQSEFVSGQTATGTLGVQGGAGYTQTTGAPGALGGVQRTVTKVQETYTTSGQQPLGPGGQVVVVPVTGGAGSVQSSRTQQSEFVSGQTATGTLGVQGGAGYTQTTAAPGALGGVQRTVTKVQETYTTSGQQPLGPGGQVVVVPVTGGAGSVQSSRTQQSEFVRGQTTTGNFGAQGSVSYTPTTGAPGALGGVHRTVTKVQEIYKTGGQGPNTVPSLGAAFPFQQSSLGVTKFDVSKLQETFGQGDLTTTSGPLTTGSGLLTNTQESTYVKTQESGLSSLSGGLGGTSEFVSGVVNPALTQKKVTTTYSSDASLSGLSGAPGSTGVTGYKKTTTKYVSSSGNLGSGLQTGGFGSGSYHTGADGKYSILKQLQGLASNGKYEYTFETENGIQAQESGEVKGTGKDGPNESVTGSYSYVAPDGQRITVKYIADENGFRPIGDHIPKTPTHVLKTLEYLAQFPH